ncbi:hypothetical protein BD779DRAFT_1566440 [Infundibulicybe gibba]|nr:hypothetical protein BD779DRAFT_1566440 [Infundibulicybe gibba]
MPIRESALSSDWTSPTNPGQRNIEAQHKRYFQGPQPSAVHETAINLSDLMGNSEVGGFNISASRMSDRTSSASISPSRNMRSKVCQHGFQRQANKDRSPTRGQRGTFTPTSITFMPYLRPLWSWLGTARASRIRRAHCLIADTIPWAAISTKSASKSSWRGHTRGS